MCMKILSRMINQSVDCLNWQPIRISKKGPDLSHLFFADDIILLSKSLLKAVMKLLMFSIASITFLVKKLILRNQKYFSQKIAPFPIKVCATIFCNKGGSIIGKIFGLSNFQWMTSKK